MATCPRCHGALYDGHRCRPVWIRRLRRQASFTLMGGTLGAFVHVLAYPGVPVIGFVLGGLVFFGLNEAFKDE